MLHLAYVDFSENEVTDAGLIVSNPGNELETLHLEGNQLETFPLAFQSAQSLVYLHLSSN